MRKIIIWLTCLVLSVFYLSCAQAAEWKVSKSTHFIVYYNQAPDDFIQRLISKAEEYYNKIADDLGFRRFDFWLWENRANIYVHDNLQDYVSATGQPAWSIAAAIPKRKEIHAIAGSEDFFETLLPHEMGHIIFREFVGFDNNTIPLWLDEGVASYQGELRANVSKEIIRQARNKNQFMDLEKLSGLDLVNGKDKEIVQVFYAEAVNIVEYLITQFGRDKFVIFCQNLRDKKNFSRALAASYPFNNLYELDMAWQKYIKGES